MLLNMLNDLAEATKASDGKKNQLLCSLGLLHVPLYMVVVPVVFVFVAIPSPLPRSAISRSLMT